MTASRLANIGKGDVVYDVGCGDGRVLIGLASSQFNDADADADANAIGCQCTNYVGIEIDADRAEEARQNVLAAYESGSLPRKVRIHIMCANALEVDYNEASVIFLYLVQRGLRLMKPILLRGRDSHSCGTKSTYVNGASSTDVQQRQCNGSNLNVSRRTLRVITYMSPFEDEKYSKRELCEVDHQRGAAWPLFLYHF